MDMKVEKIAQPVEAYLNDISFEDADAGYVPSNFALEFINFIKLVNGAEGEEHLTPVLHYRMLDEIRGKRQNICNMLFRGSAKTTLIGEYLFLYLGVYGVLPDFGEVKLALYVSDSIENGVKNMRKNLEYRWENSDFLRKYIPNTRFTDVRWEFNNINGNRLVVKGYGAKCLTLDSILYKEGSMTTIGACKVGDKIYGANGKLTTILTKSAIFNDKSMYEIKLKDGRSIRVSHDHLNSIYRKTNFNNKSQYLPDTLTTIELLGTPLFHTRYRTRKSGPDYVSKESLLFIRNAEELQYPPQEFEVDPYTLGLILGDGSIKKGKGWVSFTGHEDDWDEYEQHIEPALGKVQRDSRRPHVITRTFRNMAASMYKLNLVVHGDHKFIPEEYFMGSPIQRLALLQGLMDTDGTCTIDGKTSFCSNSKQLAEGVMQLTRSLGGTATIGRTGKAYRVQVRINKLIFRLERKANRQKMNKSVLVGIQAISRITDQPCQCISVDNDDHQFLTTDYVRTHNTGVRGSKEMGVRPVLAVLDDLVSDEDARSATVIASIEDTVYKAVNYALHPTKNKTIWSGTPFNSRDPLYKAVESGGWYVNVYPVCERFPCTEAEFRGAWEDRFTYKYVNEQYQLAAATGKIDTFNQELMLRIMSDEDRLIQDSDIRWYKHDNVLRNMGLFNFYITTDFATSEKAAADFSVIVVWAYNNNGDWFYVDSVVKRQLMDKNINDLFRLAQMYSPQQVGVEVSGQQGGFIQWIMNEQMERNIYFTLATDRNGNKPGIRPNTNKMERFNVVVPWFKLGKVYFPEEKRKSVEVGEFINELSLAAANGFRSKHDDCIDTISMLAALQPWKPSEVTPIAKDNETDIWGWEEDETPGALDSYVV